jgi:Putative transposase
MRNTRPSSSPYRDYRHDSLRKELTLSALEFIRRFRLHILPPGLVRIRHYGILGNNRRKRDIEAARAICKSSGCALALQPRSVADPPCGAMCCPSCGKAGIRLVAFTGAGRQSFPLSTLPAPTLGASLLRQPALSALPGRQKLAMARKTDTQSLTDHLLPLRLHSTSRT